eukprot:757964-Rhodomonas_salina.1
MTGRWHVWSDRAMCEDTMITAVRGGEGAQNVPTARGWMEVHSGPTSDDTPAQSVAHAPATWHIKVVEKASNRGQIYLGVEVSEELGGSSIFLGQDWYHEACHGKAYYYSSDGDVCCGNVVIERTGQTFGTGDIIGVQLEHGAVSFIKNGDSVASMSGVMGFVHVAAQLHRPGDKVVLLRELVGTAAARDIEKRK